MSFLLFIYLCPHHQYHYLYVHTSTWPHRSGRTPSKTSSMGESRTSKSRYGRQCAATCCHRLYRYIAEWRCCDRYNQQFVAWGNEQQPWDRCWKHPFGVVDIVFCHRGVGHLFLSHICISAAFGLSEEQIGKMTGIHQPTGKAPEPYRWVGRWWGWYQKLISRSEVPGAKQSRSTLPFMPSICPVSLYCQIFQRPPPFTFGLPPPYRAMKR